LIWELKPSNDLLQAKNDVEFYIDEANKKGVNAQAGEKLGLIAKNVPVDKAPGIFMDIYSNEDGVVLYDLYKYEDDKDKKVNWKTVGGFILLGGVIIVGGTILIMSGGTAAPAAGAAVVAAAASLAA